MKVAIEVIGIVVGLVGIIVSVVAFWPKPSKSWKAILKLVDKMDYDLKRRGIHFDYIISFGGGGLILADLLHIRHHPDIPVMSLVIRRRLQPRGPLTAEVDSECLTPQPLHGKSVLVVDDVVNTGRTLQAAKSFLTEVLQVPAGRVYTAVLGRPKGISGFEVDFCGFTYVGTLTLPWGVVPRDLPQIEGGSDQSR